MSCLQWDDMLAICMEFDEYSNEEVVIRKRNDHKECRRTKRVETPKTKNNEKEKQQREGSCVTLSFR